MAYHGSLLEKEQHQADPWFGCHRPAPLPSLRDVFGRIPAPHDARSTVEGGSAGAALRTTSRLLLKDSFIW